MFSYADLKHRYRGSIQDANRAGSAGAMRPLDGSPRHQRRPRAGKPRRYLLEHRHDPHECVAVHASWAGFAGRLRPRVTAATCASQGHIWWALDATHESEALAHLPAPITRRTRAIAVG
jgi:hypothetical protein